ncbi:CoA transferase [Pseudofrankia inefficax]|uniref:L-carnitine dehydratase/bile acid-inducible protein F n=1 Tax=Pseudofrankia inefficax (strain DSM 45817 / CECT 9037 / DDB 130130 / EuI1c) TaxID=298654 RepID=E3JAU8_PSEI1|nr:CoA transferase [Pseudofrankia inefficax]ADP83436.1 L-carnitine dehydratase/bile acid-inducible protein F [Pseudofrankia inefficax]
MTPAAPGPLAGLRVIEIAVGASDLGLGLAGGVPGMLLAGLGAQVTRVVGTAPLAIDAGLPWGEAWHRDKRIVTTDDAEPVRTLLADADVALAYGPEDLVEGRGLGFRDLTGVNPRLVYARCRPSRTSLGAVEDYGLLVEARSGFCTQLTGHRPGPIFVDVRAPGTGTAGLLTASVLALLRRRVLTGAGGWAETSLYDGMLATLGCMIGRSERARPEVEGYWEFGSTFPNFLYRCADGELLQVWFGGKGMYAKLIDVLGDEPSTEGYYADQSSGKLQDRALRWRAPFALRPRDIWLRRLRDAGIACEPVLNPGDALTDPHLAETGLAVTRDRDGHRETFVGSPLSVGPLPSATPADQPPAPAGPAQIPADPAPVTEAPAGGSGGTAVGGLLAGVRVLDFSAFVAGPLAAQVLADLGAEVVKVEPPEGEAMRAAAYAVAACQRGKRSLAIDITAPEARPVVESLVRWADVVLHNFRVGVAERLGIGAADVAALNPSAVYCHASAFGAHGPRAKQPGNDALMQAVTGLEQAIGGDGNEPIAATWIPIDVAGGWLAATGILAGLYARATTGTGQQVGSSLLGAGMLMQSGSFQRDGELVRGPALDAAQTGYGPGYRLYQAGDGEWFALVLPDERSWATLRGLLAASGPSAGEPASPAGPESRADDVLATCAPLRGGILDQEAREAESLLEKAFSTGTAAEWVARLRAAGLLSELIAPATRDDFRRGILDDPLNRQLGRVAAYDVADWGHFEQIGPLPRHDQSPARPSQAGRAEARGPGLGLPSIGEHSVQVLAELGRPADEIDALLANKIARQL